MSSSQPRSPARGQPEAGRASSQHVSQSRGQHLQPPATLGHSWLAWSQLAPGCWAGAPLPGGSAGDRAARPREQGAASEAVAQQCTSCQRRCQASHPRPCNRVRSGAPARADVVARLPSRAQGRHLPFAAASSSTATMVSARALLHTSLASALHE